MDISQDSDSNDSKAVESVFHFAVGGWKSAPPKESEAPSTSCVSGQARRTKGESENQAQVASPSNKRKSPFRDITNVANSDTSEIFDLSDSPGLANKSAKKGTGSAHPSRRLETVPEHDDIIEISSSTVQRRNSPSAVVTLKRSPGKGKKKAGKGMKVANIASFFTSKR